MLSEQEQIRRESLQKIIAYGINPYPAEEFKTTHYSADIIKKYSEDEKVIIAGRLMRRKIQGKASFGTLQDAKGRIQIYLNRDVICPGEDKSMYNDVFKKWLDLGDILGIEGKIFKTMVGEISINVEKIHLLSKSLKPLPQPKKDSEGVTHDAFNDPELRYRRRYVDLVVNDHVKETFIKRSKIINSMRKFLSQKEYIEVETPILQSIPGGAAARPFVTHHNALDVPLYLRIANELYLKRLIVGGFDGVYEFAKDFRNEGMDKTHNPEFTQMEMYVAYKDYHWMMNFTEEMLEFICLEVLGTTDVNIGEGIVSFKKPFKRISMIDSIKEHTGIDISKMSELELRETCKKLDIATESSMGRGKLIDEIFGEKCESNYIQPTFITDYPVEMSPLCKKHRDNPELTERFELMVNGKELANAYSELNDPIDQKSRFEDQVKLAEKGDDEAMFVDLDFIRALEYGMPPTSGMGIGIDRLVMFLCNQSSIQEVLLFPQMKPEKWDTGPNKNEYLELNISEAWIKPIYESGYTNKELLLEAKPTAVHQKLNGYRKKNKLDIPPILLEEVQSWYN
ncbi:lysine--tRNA ligase [Flavobacteriales bacterium]|jgi:lysyl-tRNA synthetase class 2|nr:lysine--tRNA ligase [Flavobacteriales bacterium]